MGARRRLLDLRVQMRYTALLSQTLGNGLRRVFLLLLRVAAFPLRRAKVVTALQFRVMVIGSDRNLDRLVVDVAQSILLMHLLVVTGSFASAESLLLGHLRLTSLTVSYLLPMVAVVAACGHAGARLVLDAFLRGPDRDLLPAHDYWVV